MREEIRLKRESGGDSESFNKGNGTLAFGLPRKIALEKWTDK